jgi:hypothetical protein
VPKDLSVRYAIMGSIAARASRDNFDRVLKYIGKFPVEFQVMCVRDSMRNDIKIRNSRAFTEWSVKHTSILV